MNKILLEKIIQDIKKYDEKLVILIPSNKVKLNEEYIIVEDEGVENDFQNALGLYLIKDVLENLRLQKDNFTLKEAEEAINFYLKNDAFINIFN